MSFERSLKVLNSLSEDDKSAWVDCVLFYQITMDRAGEVKWPFPVVEEIRCLGYHLQDIKVLDKYLNEPDVVKQLKQGAEYCKNTRDKVDTSDCSYWHMTKDEFKLFSNVVNSDLFNEIAYFVSIQDRITIGGKSVIVSATK